MNNEERTPEQEDPQASGGPEDHEADPSTGPGPRGNQDIDPERVERVEEDLDRASGAH